MNQSRCKNIQSSKFKNGDIWLGAKVYSDDKGRCTCGGSFSGKASFEGISYPICDSCGEKPKRFRIKARVHLTVGSVRYLYIRHDLSGKRLESVVDCLWIFKRVEEELAQNTFDVRKWDSKLKREAFKFPNVVKAYLEMSKLRFEKGEISPYGFESKLKYSKFLVSFFKDVDISNINSQLIEKYRNSFVKGFSNRDMSLGELKTILNYAFRADLIRSVPAFVVPSTKKRKTVPDLAEANEKIIPFIKDVVKREALKMLCDYGIRPCEVRAIQFEQIDLAKNRIIIDRHFSKNTLLMGRKGHREGKFAVIDRPLTKSLRSFIESRPLPIDQREFLFTSGKGKPLSVSSLSKSWKMARQALSLTPVQLYGVRGAKITEVLEASNGNMVLAKNFAGHSDIHTTMSRYDYSENDVDSFIGSTD